jgi:hypothetical protein
MILLQPIARQTKTGCASSLVSAGGEEDVDVAELFVDHQTQQAHHSSTTLVQLDSALLELGLFL